MNVLLVDDEKLARERLKRMLQDSDWQVVGEASNGKDAILEVETVNPDVVLLDIRMPGMDGLEAARHLATAENPPAIIFCTAYEEHAMDAFDVSAVDYLLKPVRREQLLEALSRATRLNRAQLSTLALEEDGVRSRTHISARTRRGIELIPITNVLFFQADQKYVTVRHTGGEVLIDETLRDLEIEFGRRFFRVHRNALIAVSFLDGLQRTSEGHYQARLSCDDNQESELLDVSRRHVAELKRFIQSL